MPAEVVLAPAPFLSPMPTIDMGRVSMPEFAPSILPEVNEHLQIAENIILNHLPPPEMRLHSHPERVSVMAHEFGHALLAINKGYNGQLTARPGGEYRGLTTIYGAPSEKDFVVIAAGGSYPFMGEAQGFQHDFYQIASRGHSIESAKTAAHAELDGFTREDPRLIPRAAEIATYLENSLNVDGLSFDLVLTSLKRAREELAVEDAGISDTIYKWLGPFGEQERSDLRDIINAQLLKPQDYHQIVDHVDGKHYILIVKDGKPEGMYEFCPRCGMKGGNHSSECLHMNSQNSDGVDSTVETAEALSIDDTLDTVTVINTESDPLNTSFPRKSTIFAGTD